MITFNDKLLKNRLNDFSEGVKSAFPIVIGYIPIGITYGLLAIKAGLTVAETVLMSLMVFAGSSQFLAVNMIEMNFDFFSIVVTTFLVNLRHLLFSVSLALKLKKTPNFIIPVVSFLITDESFAVSINSIENYECKYCYFLGLGLTGYISWFLSSLLGATVGFLFYHFDISFLDFILPAMFIALLVIQIKTKRDILISIMSGLFSILSFHLLGGSWNIIIATLLSATVGVIIEDD